MTQNFLTLPGYLQQMKFEIELRGLSSQTLQHYLSHLRLLEKYFDKPTDQISPDELLYLLKQAFSEGKMSFFNEATRLALKGNFLSLVDQLYRHNWVVFCRKPFKTPAHVVRYLGRYTHRVAIGNSRIQSFDGQSVSFSWKDYKDKGKSKVMTLDATEFTRRFRLHVLRIVLLRSGIMICFAAEISIPNFRNV